MLPPRGRLRDKDLSARRLFGRRAQGIVVERGSEAVKRKGPAGAASPSCSSPWLPRAQSAGELGNVQLLSQSHHPRGTTDLEYLHSSPRSLVRAVPGELISLASSLPSAQEEALVLPKGTQAVGLWAST